MQTQFSVEQDYNQYVLDIHLWFLELFQGKTIRKLLVYATCIIVWIGGINVLSWYTDIIPAIFGNTAPVIVRILYFLGFLILFFIYLFLPFIIKEWLLRTKYTLNIQPNELLFKNNKRKIEQHFTLNMIERMQINVDDFRIYTKTQYFSQAEHIFLIKQKDQKNIEMILTFYFSSLIQKRQP